MYTIHKRILIVFTILFIYTQPSWAFFGMMKSMMGSSPISNPSQMLLTMCNSPAGQMGAQMMKGMSSMMGSMPFVGGMMKGVKNNMSGNMMSQVLMNPELTLKALDCAKKNNNIVGMMISTMSSNRRLLYRIGDYLSRDGRVAKSLLDLSIKRPQVGRFLLQNVDPILFNQITHALKIFPQMALDLTNLVTIHRHEVLRRGSRLMNVFKDWQTYTEDSDGTEEAVEKFIYFVFSNSKAANLFMAGLEDIAISEKKYILDILFLGSIKDHYFDHSTGQWTDSLYSNQSYYNIYTMIYALKEDSSEEGRRLMMNMMKYMIDPENKRPTAWGIQFLNATMSGINIHGDQDMIEFGNSLMKIMPSIFRDNLPPGDPNSPVPRKSFL